MNHRIETIQAIQVIDSRGNPTVSVRVQLNGGAIAFASVPSGASTGEYEAVELRDGDSSRFLGKGVLKAVTHINTTIKNALVGVDSREQAQIDSILRELDGTPNKSKIGANAILGVSLTVARAAAAACGKELYEFLGSDQSCLLPVPLVNVINGGAHANNSLDIQEFMVVPHGAPTFSEAIRYSAEVFHALGDLLRDDGYDTAVGDEGGYAPRLESTNLAFEFLLQAIERAGYRPGEQISLALDVAASELALDGTGSYEFARSGLGILGRAELLEMYQSWMSLYPIVSIEDGLGENDWQGWTEMTKKLGGRTQIVGDDLLVTNSEKIKKAIDLKAVNSVLIKPNQIGTLTETLDAIETTKQAHYTAVISHRSGETCDATIADLSVATNSGQIKTGSMSRGERTTKYNRLLWIESMLGSKAEYKNPFN